MISITLNGKPREVEPPASVRDFLERLDINPAQVAVAVNGDVIPRDRWPHTTIRAGDTVEIVRAVGGGAEGWAPWFQDPRVRRSGRGWRVL